MKLIVGLGNPEKKYEPTRHNLGFMVVDKLADELGTADWQTFSPLSQVCILHLGEQPTYLLKPQTFMNESGKSVREISNFYKIQPADIWLVQDELDLPLGTVRLSPDSSAAGHRGVQSVIDELGTQTFGRWRLGIGRPETVKPAEVFVLEPFDQTEQTLADKMIKQAVELIKQALVQNIETINPSPAKP